MAKFHVNDKGEAGKCGALQGKCPFGGESGQDNHYDTPAAAREAYEKKNAGETVSSLKKTSKRVAKDKFAPNITRENYAEFAKENHINRPYEAVVFDEEEIRASLAGDPDIDAKVETLKAEWKEKDRIHPAEDGEIVPARLIPTGSKVWINNPEDHSQRRAVTFSKVTANYEMQENGKYKKWATVEYRYKGETHHAIATDKFEVAKVSDRSIAKAWEHENTAAYLLLQDRQAAHQFIPGEKARLNAIRDAMSTRGPRNIKDEEDYMLKDWKPQGIHWAKNPEAWDKNGKYLSKYGCEKDRYEREFWYYERSKLAFEGDPNDKEAKAAWDDMERLKTAKEGETAPLRLVPEGSKVRFKDPETQIVIDTILNESFRVKDEKGNAIATYTDATGLTRTVTGEDRVEILEASEKMPSSHWDNDQNKAKALEGRRRFFAEYSKDPFAFDENQWKLQSTRPSHPGINTKARPLNNWNPPTKEESIWWITAKDESMQVVAETKDEAKAAFVKGMGLSSTKGVRAVIM